MTTGIYIWTNNINGKKYVGQSLDCEHRCYVHFKSKYPIGAALRKYGKDNFMLEIISCPAEHLDMWERFYIHFYDTFSKNGYNLTSGGTNGCKKGPMSEEQKQLISQKNIEYFANMTPEQREEYSKICSTAQIEKWKKISDDQRIEIGNKIAETKKGHTVEEETRFKISQTLTGRKDTEETRLKKCGRTPHNKGTQASEETKQKISQNSARRGQQGTMLGKKHTSEARKKITENNLGTSHYNNGVKTIRVPDNTPIPEGFVPGRLMKSQRPFSICGQRFVSIIVAAETLGINKNTIFGRLQSISNTDYVYI